MTKHLVLGTGNLGMDLALALTDAGLNYHLIGRHGGNTGGYFDFTGRDGDPEHRGSLIGYQMRDLQALEPDVVWCTIGAGGPDAASPAEHFLTHVSLPLALAEWAPKLILFSTAYLNHDPDGRYSYYAMSKSAMERAMLSRQHVRCIRVGSLYGTHAPMKCLPGKVMRAMVQHRLNRGATNEITPTPTAWLADELIKSEVWDRFCNVEPGANWAPSGKCSAKHWIETIIRDFTEGDQGLTLTPFLAENYPHFAASGVVGQPDWYILWEIYRAQMKSAIRPHLDVMSVLRRVN